MTQTVQAVWKIALFNRDEPLIETAKGAGATRGSALGVKLAQGHGPGEDGSITSRPKPTSVVIQTNSD